MKSGAIWGIALGVGIPGTLILIGLIGLLIKFIMKRCQRKAWNDISTPPKQTDIVENDLYQRKFPKRTSSDRLPLYQGTANTSLEISEGHVSIPVNDETNPSSNQNKHTLVQIQRDRLNRLKEEENRERPMLQLDSGDLGIQRAIDQAQREFDESVPATKTKHHRHK